MVKCEFLKIKSDLESQTPAATADVCVQIARKAVLETADFTIRAVCSKLSKLGPTKSAMSLVSVLRLLQLPKCNITPFYCAVQNNGYAAPVGLGKLKKLKKGGAGTEKKVLPVETDANKLAKYVCGTNIYKEGQDVEIKADSEYPEWLWDIRIGAPPRLEDLDPETKAYWRKLRKQALTRKNRHAATRRF